MSRRSVSFVCDVQRATCKTGTREHRSGKHAHTASDQCSEGKKFQAVDFNQLTCRQSLDNKSHYYKQSAHPIRRGIKKSRLPSMKGRTRDNGMAGLMPEQHLTMVWLAAESLSHSRVARAGVQETRTRVLVPWPGPHTT